MLHDIVKYILKITIITVVKSKKRVRMNTERTRRTRKKNEIRLSLSFFSNRMLPDYSFLNRIVTPQFYPTVETIGCIKLVELINLEENRHPTHICEIFV